jgi:ribosomal protein L37AE/L43A
MKEKHVCPECSNSKVKRIGRKPWMRVLPMSKHYDCTNCGCEFVTVFNRVKIKTMKGRSFTFVQVKS